jgi:hypothetical protein
VLVRRFGSPHDAALEAIKDPLFKRAFGDLGPVQVVEQDRRLYAVPSAPSEDRFWDVVYAWAEGQPLEEPDADEATDRVQRRDPVAPAPTWPPLPNGINDFAHGTIEKAVKAVRRGDTDGDVSRAAKLPPADTARVRLMDRAKLLPLNAAGKLVPDERVARNGSRLVLRYLDESGTRWLDPKRKR